MNKHLTVAISCGILSYKDKGECKMKLLKKKTFKQESYSKRLLLMNIDLLEIEGELAYEIAIWDESESVSYTIIEKASSFERLLKHAMFKESRNKFNE